MKVVILAGGYGTRISEESTTRPKPLVEIGGKPILWHLMKYFSHYGFTDFIICLGYKGYMLKEYFSNYFLHMSDVTFDFKNNTTEYHKMRSEPWKVTLVDTGEGSMTGGRLKRVKNFIDDEDFCFTYGDGLSDVNLDHLVNFHKKHGKLATITTVQPKGKYGVLSLEGTTVSSFQEKPRQSGLINAGFFVLSPRVLEYIESDQTTWEDEPLRRLVEEFNLKAFQHHGFWRAMDTLKDKRDLEELWINGKARWKVW
tara:strand:- start:1950 stop:2714 length:765 start_codon:yes stop_codon:yes gene_type:complete